MGMVWSFPKILLPRPTIVIAMKDQRRREEFSDESGLEGVVEGVAEGGRGGRRGFDSECTVL